MKKALITGATGFTGRYLAPKLADAGYDVHGTVHGDAGSTFAGIAELHELDIGDSGAVRSLVARLKPDKLVHLAAISFAAHSDLAEMYRANILGTRNLLAALASCDSVPSAVLVASSANIYGNTREGILDENAPPSPANDYGFTKAAAELLVSSYRERLPLIVARPFNYTGRGQSEQFLIPKIVAHVQRRASEIELGNIDVARDFSDVRGVVDAYARLLETPAAVGQTFNICSGRAVAIREVLDLLARISGHELRVRVNPDLVRPNEVKCLCGSAAKLESVIGPTPMPPLEQTLRWMFDE